MGAVEINGLRRGKNLKERYQLFKSDTCGFCFRVRAYGSAGMELPLRDVHADAEAFRELLQEESTKRCLRIERSTDTESKSSGRSP